MSKGGWNYVRRRYLTLYNTFIFHLLKMLLLDELFEGWPVEACPGDGFGLVLWMSIRDFWSSSLTSCRPVRVSSRRPGDLLSGSMGRRSGNWWLCLAVGQAAAAALSCPLELVDSELLLPTLEIVEAGLESEKDIGYRQKSEIMHQWMSSSAFAFWYRLVKDSWPPWIFGNLKNQSLCCIAMAIWNIFAYVLDLLIMY